MHLASAGGEEQVVLLVVVEMTNTESVSEGASCDRLAKVAAVPNSEFSLGLLVETRSQEEVIVDPCKFNCFGASVGKTSLD